MRRLDAPLPRQRHDMKLYNSPYAFASYYNQMIYTTRVAPLQGSRIGEAKTERVNRSVKK